MDWLLVMWIALLVVGLGLLVKGADWFVDGSAGIARKANVSPLLIGLTIVAFGTSAPELAVSVTGAIQGVTDIAVGNVVGSNIANILLILGITSLIRKLPVKKNSLTLDLPVLLGAGALLIGFGVWGEKIVWWEGLILLGVLAAYMTVLLVRAKKEIKAQRLNPPAQEPLESPDEEKKPEKPKSKVKLWFEKMEGKLWFCIILALVGLGMVVGGGILFVECAKRIASALGASERIIGLTVVAIGTSLPELVTSIVAVAKKETDIAVGNIIGSNIFNILLIAGAASLFHPLAFNLHTNLIDALVAFGASVLLYVFALFDKRRLGIPAGVVFLSFYIAYYVYLFLMPAV